MKITRDVGLFGTATRTNVLLVLALLGESHVAEIARLIKGSKTNVANAIDSLEQAGVVSGILEGTTRRVSINPRYPYKAELAPLLQKMSVSHPGIVQAVSELRHRSRRSGKEI